MVDKAQPKVFISHATEDKDRFVMAFAKELRDRGVDAWLDKWEMRPGDKLVDRIFEEGIGSADAFIVVLSSMSVNKSWVREELDAAFVRRVSDKCRIIPVVIDDCEVPVCLQSTLWVSVKDLNNYESSLNEIVNTLYGLSDKPKVGPPPAASSLESKLAIQGCTKLDTIVFEILCKESVSVGHPFVSNLDGLQKIIDAGVSDQDLRDSLKVLEDEYYLELGEVISGGFANTGVSHVRITTHGFDIFARQTWGDYDAVLNKLVSGIVNEGWGTRDELLLVDDNPRLVDHLMRFLEEKELLTIQRHMQGYWVSNVSPKLRRALQDN